MTLPIKMSAQTTHTVGLVGCGKAKRAARCKARDMYTSALFGLASRYCERTYGRWFILSAKHGLLAPDTEIEPYDERVPTAALAARCWANLVSVQLIEHWDGAAVYAHAGADYVGPLSEWREMHTPLAGLQIGQRLAWYKQREGT